MRHLNSAALATLRFFEAAARLQSFTRAGTELCVTQGAVSHHVKYLEDFLGCKLFFRLPKQIKLTDEGKQFAEVAARLMRELDEAAAAIIAPRKSRIDVRLRAGPSFALRWLVPRLGHLHALRPNIKLHVIGEYGYFDPVHRDFDLAVEFLQAPRQGLHTEFLMDEFLVPVCSPEYLAENELLKKPADLTRCTLLHDGEAWEAASEDAEWRYWLSEVGALSVDSNEGQFFTMANMAIEAALAHQGVAKGAPLPGRRLAGGQQARHSILGADQESYQLPPRLPAGAGRPPGRNGGRELASRGSQSRERHVGGAKVA